MFTVETREEASNLLVQARRIMVIGCSGGGKSTLSRKLAAALDLPNHSMDREVFWLPNWVERAKAEQRAILSEIVKADKWLLDGTNPSSFDIRLPRTDLVIWVRLPRWRCLLGVFRRVSRNIGRRAMAGPRIPLLHLELRAPLRPAHHPRNRSSRPDRASRHLEIPRRNGAPA